MSFIYPTGIKQGRSELCVSLPDFPVMSDRVQINRLKFNSDEATETLTLTRSDIPGLIQALRKAMGEQ